MASAGYKALIADGVWAADPTAHRTLPEAEGIDRAEGWPVGYEQLGSGSVVGRGEWNNHLNEMTAALIDLADHGVLPWDADLNYVPGDDWCFTKTASGLWRTNVNTGPRFGNATDPETEGQTIWRRF